MSHTLGDSLRQKAGKALQTAAGLSAVFVARNLSPSVASLAQRLAGCGRTTDTLPSGSPLPVSLAGVAEHSGIYIGDGMVAERSGEGKLRVVTLSEFLNGCEGDGLKVRGGLRIYAWCDLDSGRVLADLAVGGSEWAWWHISFGFIRKDMK